MKYKKIQHKLFISQHKATTSKTFFKETNNVDLLFNDIPEKPFMKDSDTI